MATSRPGRGGWSIALLGLLLATASAAAAPQEKFQVDPAIFRLEDRPFQGLPFLGQVALLDELGDPLDWQGLLGRPVILVPGYYTCEAKCSSMAMSLKELQKGVGGLTAGEDYTVLSLSFDHTDSVASLNVFRQFLKLPREQERAWRFALFAQPDRIVPELARLGYRFVWSPEERTFYHPTVMMIFTPEGRVARYLDIFSITPRDIQLALLEAAQHGEFRLSRLPDSLLVALHRFNEREGRYEWRGDGLLLGGTALLAGAAGWLLLRRRRRPVSPPPPPVAPEA
ncbi:MAG: hypothetical protein HQL51_01410 [Magnetococcales bacterium]|nr:hypothetical protein [Magnetococcales bacterium]